MIKKQKNKEKNKFKFLIKQGKICKIKQIQAKEYLILIMKMNKIN